MLQENRRSGRRRWEVTAVAAGVALSTFGIATPAHADARLVIDKSHVGNFVQGQSGATYSIVVSNTGDNSVEGQVRVLEQLPDGLTATGLSGDGWQCNLEGMLCYRTDPLPAQQSYPTITLTVNVGTTVCSVINTVFLESPNAPTQGETDYTVITGGPCGGNGGGGGGGGGGNGGGGDGVSLLGINLSGLISQNFSNVNTGTIKSPNPYAIHHR
ncbi:hypothetical protein ACGFYU_32770 [Streptomyces sp. NPDC048337]|uniref:hypothetical protein n=1 Tax=Streptomyces sp. NPDC048337 TaxID=3365535 RepID=UPI003710887E